MGLLVTPFSRSAATRIAAGRPMQRGPFFLRSLSTIDKEGLKQRIEGKHKGNYLLIDVREPNEVMGGAIPTAINIPLGQLEAEFNLKPAEFKKRYGVEKPTATTEVIFSCRAGPRAMQAAKFLSQSVGHPKTLCYYGSWVDWSKSSSRIEAPKQVSDTIEAMARMRGRAMGIGGLGFVIIGVAMYLRSTAEDSSAEKKAETRQ